MKTVAPPPLVVDVAVVEYRARRLAVRKEPPADEIEWYRRDACPRPDKAAYEPTDIGRKAATHHAELLRYERGDHTTPYVCTGCGWLHTGHPDPYFQTRTP